MQNEPKQDARYEFIGPNAEGLIRLQMANLNPNNAGEFFCVTLGSDKNGIAEAMRVWLRTVDQGDGE